MLRIERSVRGALAVFAVSGRVGVKNLAELERIVEFEAAQRKVLNLKDLTLVDRHAVGFLARCEAEGTPLENCPIYVRQWMVRQGPPCSWSELFRKETFGMKTMRETSGTEERTVYRGETGSSAPDFHGIVGRSAALQRVLRLVETVATTDAAILIRGETGTGKELIAGLIHRLSARRGPLVKFNCTAIPAGLLESELFGHERGAFTSAIARRIGRFELADNGTLFLDEIGDLPLDLQPKLLRVLEEQAFERIGSTQMIRTDVRVIAATNRPLEELVEAEEFRADLFYRLNVFPIDLPPLRERTEDIPPLVRHFVAHYARNVGRRIDAISPDVIDTLVHYPWPGNVRELQHVLHRAVILSDGGSLELPPLAVGVARPPAPRAKTYDDALREHIVEVLRETNGLVAGPRGAAVRLGLKRTTLLSKMQKLGITPDGAVSTPAQEKGRAVHHFASGW
jgi:transcriptional regulator with GAF, ATPase, and Fis domain